MPKSLNIVTLFVVLGLTACSPTSALNTVVPSASYDLHRDIAYASDPRQQMDIYVPTDSPVKSQVVVFVYGGSWEEGEKQDFEFIGQAFARLGYVTVIPDYRLYPQVEFPEFIDDIAIALTAIPAQLRELELCPSGREIVLTGHSAGAHTAALIATDPQYLQRQQNSNTPADEVQLTALIGLAGPYDLPLEHERVKDKFSRVQDDEANPIALATAQTPPTLLIHGESDTVARPEHATKFAERLQSLGVYTQIHTYPRRRHVDLVASLASPLRFWTPAYEDIQVFLEDQALNSVCTER